MKQSLKKSILSVAKSQETDFAQLLKVGGLNPSIDLRGADWSGIDFAGCNLFGCDFTGARLWDCKFEGARIAGARFDGAEIDHTSLYTGDNLGVHDPRNPRISSLRAADDWEKYVKTWGHKKAFIINQSKINGGDVIKAHHVSDDHLPTGAIFQDAPFAPEMVTIPPGKFMMGTSREKIEALKKQNDVDYFDCEGPQQEVLIPERFAVSRFAVTFEEYDAFCEATNRKKPNDEGWGRGQRPVINISWFDMCQYDKTNRKRCYLSWLSQRTGHSYRLLSEAEWEYACRANGPADDKYHFGNDEDKFGDYAWYRTNSNNKTHPVGKKKPNSFGLYDIHGNIWEMVADQWHKNYEKIPIDVLEQGVAWDEGSLYERVLRNGHYSLDLSKFNSARRLMYFPASTSSGVGFRVARHLLLARTH